MKTVRVFGLAGSFAENKDAAARIRDESLVPTLSDGQSVKIDFARVDFATQSFIHAMLAKVVRTNDEWLDKITFVNCSDAVKGIIEIVVDYAQETD